uniref:Uncharacterized protein n=1 Tax=Anopheles farauti TaxID=69004 RepID=A0A182QKP3_9DIPT
MRASSTTRKNATLYGSPRNTQTESFLSQRGTISECPVAFHSFYTSQLVSWTRFVPPYFLRSSAGAGGFFLACVCHVSICKPGDGGGPVLRVLDHYPQNVLDVLQRVTEPRELGDLFRPAVRRCDDVQRGQLLRVDRKSERALQTGNAFGGAPSVGLKQGNTYCFSCVFVQCAVVTPIFTRTSLIPPIDPASDEDLGVSWLPTIGAAFVVVVVLTVVVVVVVAAAELLVAADVDIFTGISLKLRLRERIFSAPWPGSDSPPYSSSIPSFATGPSRCSGEATTSGGRSSTAPDDAAATLLTRLVIEPWFWHTMKKIELTSSIRYSLYDRSMAANGSGRLRLCINAIRAPEVSAVGPRNFHSYHV